MLRSFPIGRLFGIRLDVHASWFLIYALVTGMIANAAPIAAFGRVTSLAIGAASALAIFASVLVHELAHALVARRFGVRTTSIELFLFGGVAMIEAEPPTPLADALVAFAGPLASALLAAAGLLLVPDVDRFVPPALSSAAVAALIYVAYANGVIAVFNLVPAYPMDGGRILRAAIWALRRDRDGATASVALVGIGLALALAVTGIAAVAATHQWTFGWYVVLASYLVYQCTVQYRSLRRTPARSTAPALRPAAAEAVA